MQLALTPEVLVPVGAGALFLALALLVVVLVVRRRRRTRALGRPTVADAVRETGSAPQADLPAESPDADPVESDPPGAHRPDTEPAAAGEQADRAELDPADRVGSGRTVAAAVAQALAVREARARVAAADAPPAEPPPSDEPAEQAPVPDAAWSAPEQPVPSERGDARDRLLAVLLDDPVRAVGATVELDACRRQLDRLTDAVRHERETLRSVLTRLADAGLAPDQLARLSGLSDDELRGLLSARVGVG
ncbi:hypothetical protein GCM10017691_01800 [Pseudonocardia petroleophila]|uniref:Uncharacterized protein n=1 Tax=Pseudonocardia petroleophila TaxID=37331 RepID=A0A7G7ML72_9PSEU|nr:hypothetical protein [Pseudonocardia petroleophila]QNG53533.1 hypothetical protein H6H00_06090 [Pseudonocardia petroleophila]